MRVYNGRLITIENGTFPCGYVDFEEGKITAFGPMETAPAYNGPAFDAKGGWIMPGLIDAHSHIAICEQSSGGMGNDCNENNNIPATPDMRAIDGINPWDPSIKTSREAGVTTVAVCPGSANAIGGQIAAVKLAGESVEEMAIKPVAAIKMALGENPKRSYMQKNLSPKTRMATAAIIRKYLTNAQLYAEKKAAGEDVWDPQLEPLLPLLRREIPVHIHSQEADDLFTAMQIAHTFNLRYSLVHAADADRMLNYMAKEDSIPIFGPYACWSSQHEMVNLSPATAGRMVAAGIEVAITTDHDVTPLWMLTHFAGLAVREGMPEDAAFRAVTINGAKAMGVDDRVGSIAVGKDADIVVFNGHPFEYLTKTDAVFINGKRYK